MIAAQTGPMALVRTVPVYEYRSPIPPLASPRCQPEAASMMRPPADEGSGSDEVRVVVPEGPPVFTPDAARALLRILDRARARVADSDAPCALPPPDDS
jgi:hypothetical protein